MHLIGKTVLAASIISASACHDVTGPPPLPATYVLASINGRPLPTPFSPVPEAPVILNSTLFLDGTGNAVLTEWQQVMIAPGQVTYSTNYTYTIQDNTIEFHFQCPPDALALCASPPVGTFLNSHLYLTFGTGDNKVIYDYRLGGEI